MALCLRIFLGMVPSLEGLTRTMTSDLPVRLGSCVLSVLQGNRQADDVETAMLYDRSCVTFARVELLKSFPESTKKTDVVLVVRAWDTLPNKLWSGLKCLRTREEFALPSIHHTRATEDTPLVDLATRAKEFSVLACSTDFSLSDWPCVSPETLCCDVQTRPPFRETSTILCPL